MIFVVLVSLVESRQELWLLTLLEQQASLLSCDSNRSFLFVEHSILLAGQPFLEHDWRAAVFFLLLFHSSLWPTAVQF